MLPLVSKRKGEPPHASLSFLIGNPSSQLRKDFLTTLEKLLDKALDNFEMFLYLDFLVKFLIPYGPCLYQSKY